jgi:anti-anti-sigma regulatory factor
MYMNVKIDTKEKFTVIRLPELNISANMSDDVETLFRSYLSKPVPHLVVDLSSVESIDPAVAENMADLQQEFYEKNASFVFCCMTRSVEEQLDEQELLESLNVTPTESEAWDIVQMEEIERELLGDMDDAEG